MCLRYFFILGIVVCPHKILNMFSKVQHNCYLKSLQSLQDQDSHGGGFDVKQSFVGMMADVHMWDYIISPSEIQSYTQGFVSFTPGNVLNWRLLEFQIIGKVLIEGEQWSLRV